MSGTQSLQEELDSIEEIIRDANTRDRNEDRITEAVRLAESVVQRYPDEPDAHHLLGLAWYHFPASSSTRSWHSRNALLAAVGLDPDHQYALQYLAYLAFDQERYDEALEWQSRLRSDYFMARNQEWRVLKNIESSLVCRLRLDRVDDIDQDLKLFFKSFRDAQRREQEHFDAGSYVWPQELREYAEWLFEKGTPTDDPRLASILRFISQIGFAFSYWNLGLRARFESEGPKK